MLDREELALHNEHMLFCDGFDEALVGVAHRPSEPTVACYDINKMIEILVTRDNMEEDDALEYILYNVIGAYMGENTPVYLEEYRGN